MPRRAKRPVPQPSPWSPLTPAGVVLIVLVTLGYLPPSDMLAACDAVTHPPTAGLVSLLIAALAIERQT